MICSMVVSKSIGMNNRWNGNLLRYVLGYRSDDGDGVECRKAKTSEVICFSFVAGFALAMS